MRKTKALLSIIVTLAIITAGILTSSAAETEINITNATELAEAIRDQQDGQVWKIAAGEYDLTQALMNEYAHFKPNNSNDKWYFPIVETISIIGIGNPTITSSYEQVNGSLNTQDLISVWADDVSIEGIQIKCKKDINKAIEVLGKNFKIKDCTILGQDNGNGTVNSGSILFNPFPQTNKDVGNVVIENVSLSCYISARPDVVEDGSIALKNVTMDLSNNTNITKDTAYVALSNNDGLFKNEGLTVIIDDSVIDIAKQIISNLPDGTVVELSSDIELDSQLFIGGADIIIDGKGHTITASDNYQLNQSLSHPENLITVYESNIELKNVNIAATEDNKHTLNVVDSNVVLTDVELDNSKAGLPGAPLILNTSTATVNGALNIITGEKSWYGVNIDNKSEGGESWLKFNEGASFHFSGNTELKMFVDDGKYKSEIIAPLNAGLIEKDGVFRFVIPVETLTLNKNALTLDIGANETLTYTVNPGTADILSDPVWTSSDPSVAKVENGKVIALKAGTTNITLTLDGVSATCAVTVKAVVILEPEKPETTVNPPTGDILPAMLILVFAAAFVSTLIFIKRKKAQA